MVRTHRLVWILFLLCLGTSRPGAADEVEPVPADTAILEFNVPVGATLMVDGRDYSRETRMTFRPLKEDRLYQSEVKVRFADGAETQDQILMRGGWRIQLPIRNPREPKIEPVLQTGHTGLIHVVKYSADGRWIITGANDNAAIVWSAREGRQLRRLTAPQFVRDLAISPDGREVIAACYDHLVLWDLHSGEVKRSLKADGRQLFRSVAFNPDGRRFIVGGTSRSEKQNIGTLNTGDTHDSLRLDPFATSSGEINSVRYSPDGRRILSCSGSPFEFNSPTLVRSLSDSLLGEAAVWDATSGHKLFSLPIGARSILSGVYSSDGQLIASCTSAASHAVKISNAQTGELLQTLEGHTDVVRSLAFSPDGQRLATGSSDKTVAIWDVQTGKKLFSSSCDGSVYSVAFSPDGSRLAAAADNRLIFIDPQSGRRTEAIQHDASFENYVDFSSDGRRMISGGRNATTWDTQSGRRLSSLTTSASDVIGCAAFSPDSRSIATGMGNGTVVLWTANDVGKARTLSAFSDDKYHSMYKSRFDTGLFVTSKSVSCLDFSPDGRHLVIGSSNAPTIIWDIATDKELHLLDHQGHRSEARYSPDGGLVATAFKNEDIAIWNARTGELVRTLGAKRGDVMDLAWSPDGSRIAVASETSIVLWDPHTSAQIRAIAENESRLSSVSFNHDGKLIAATSWTGIATVWGTVCLPVIPITGRAESTGVIASS